MNSAPCEPSLKYVIKHLIWKMSLESFLTLFVFMMLGMGLGKESLDKSLKEVSLKLLDQLKGGIGCL